MLNGSLQDMFIDSYHWILLERWLKMRKPASQSLPVTPRLGCWGRVVSSGAAEAPRWSRFYLQNKTAMRKLFSKLSGDGGGGWRGGLVIESTCCWAGGSVVKNADCSSRGQGVASSSVSEESNRVLIDLKLKKAFAAVCCRRPGFSAHHSHVPFCNYSSGSSGILSGTHQHRRTYTCIHTCRQTLRLIEIIKVII